MTEDKLRRTGVAGDHLVQELVLYPILRCRAIRKQRIDYTVNESGKEPAELSRKLEWATSLPRSEYQGRSCVRSSDVALMKQMQLHPVPVSGRDCEDRVRLLPAPHIDSNGDLAVTTLLSHADWSDWYVYEAEFQDCAETIDLAASQNDVAFRPTSCWTTLLDDDDNDEDEDDGNGVENEPSSSEISGGSLGRGVGGTPAESQDHKADGLVRVAECALEPLGL